MSEKKGTKARRHGATKGIALRRVAVVTGTRAEYGLLRSTMKALADCKGVELQLVVTGSHLLRKFGHTIDEIVADGWNIDARVPMQKGTDDVLDQAQALARGVAGIARYLARAQTDIIVVLGDRIEAMAGALAATTTGKILTHVHGGDRAAGDFDDALRHSISKLAHLHFPATQEAADRINRMGEAAWRVRVVGAPGLDRIRVLVKSKEKPANHVPRRALIVQHPCGRSHRVEQHVTQNVLEAVRLERLEALCLYPNTDRGHRGVLDAITAHASRENGRFEIRRSLPRDEFILAMRDADVLVGNSSSGIIEAAYVGTPAVNVGPRQNGRQTSGRSVIHSKETLPAIRAALQEALRVQCVKDKANVFGDGRAGLRIARALARVRLTEQLYRKLNAY